MFIPNFKNIVIKLFPFLTWLKNYNVEFAVADFITGITVGLTLIPQCIAYSNLAGVEPQFGLYSGICGGLIYAVLGTTAEANVGPSALLSLLTVSFTSGVTYGNMPLAVFLCFLAGIIELLCGLFNLGFLFEFVSVPVVAAFTSAGAVIIASEQVKNLLGLNFTAETFIGVWKNVFMQIKEVKKWDAILGFSCCVILLLLRKLKDMVAPPLEDTQPTRTHFSITRKLIWFCSVARNALVVIICTVVAYVLSVRGLKPFTLTSDIPQGLPTVKLPIPHTQNGTTTEIFHIIRDIGPGLVIVPFVAVLGNVAIAKTFARGKIVDTSQELIAVGVINLTGSFLGSIPVHAAFSRAAVSDASGVKTPFAGVYTTTMVVLALTFLTPYFSYIPSPTLAAVVICAIIFVIEINLTRLMYKTNKIDLIPFVITSACCLLISIGAGIFIGVCVDILFLLYNSARPKLHFEIITLENVKYVRVTPTSAVLFPSAEYIRQSIMRYKKIETLGCKAVVFDCHKISRIDFTTAKCLAAFTLDLQKVKKEVVFFKPNKQIAKILNNITNNKVTIVEREEDIINAIQENISNDVDVEKNHDEDDYKERSEGVTQL